jgi:hypothetical protein
VGLASVNTQAATAAPVSTQLRAAVPYADRGAYNWLADRACHRGHGRTLKRVYALRDNNSGFVPSTNVYGRTRVYFGHDTICVVNVATHRTAGKLLHRAIYLYHPGATHPAVQQAGYFRKYAGPVIMRGRSGAVLASVRLPARTYDGVRAQLSPSSFRHFRF